MANTGPVLRIRNEYELQDLIDAEGRDASLIERDFALTVIAAGLVAEYGDALCFKGGYVLRHVYGHDRFSKDIDTTKVNPPKSKLDSEQVAITIRESGMRNLLSLNAGEPATDSPRSLDFDHISYTGPLGSGFVSVEVSYREALVKTPHLVAVGHPYYEPFEIPVMQLDEIAAEKLRALAQRQRPTDLSDLAMILRDNEIDKQQVRTIFPSISSRCPVMSWCPYASAAPRARRRCWSVRNSESPSTAQQYGHVSRWSSGRAL
jgi:predicted nucleotidyltransferase component of viral defense system